MMKMTLWLCLVIVTMATCIYGFDTDYFDNFDDSQGYVEGNQENDGGSQANTDDTYNELINMDMSIDSLSRFMGFKCPKGYRCLPVLECLPCDYGSYKPKLGAGLCKICPPGCTTLRKGAESWKECVPKCPPGYEESECGKTCTKCRSGRYKSTWKNEKCRTCPSNAHFDRNTVGMRRRSQCYAFDVTTEEMETVVTERPVDTGCEALGVCTTTQYTSGRLVPAPGMGCTTFCQCAHRAGSTGEQQIHYWQPMPCAPGTLFDVNLQVCTFTDQCIGETLLSTWHPTNTEVYTEGPPVTQGCDALDPCTIDIYEDPNNNHVSAPGSNCKQFCQCAYDAHLISYYWESHDCAAGTLFDDTLNVCAHEAAVTCASPTIHPSPPTDTPMSTEVTNGCRALDPCTEDIYGDPNNNHVSAPGSNCEQFCQCAYDDQLISYYWESHDCAAGTLFDDTLNVCAHEAAVTCASPTNHPSRSTDTPMSTEVTKGCWALGPCTQAIYGDPNNNHVSAPGSNCEQFCQCAYDAQLISYYWESHDCAAGTLFDDTLNVCAHEAAVTCASPTNHPSRSTDTPMSTEVTKGCWALGPCTQAIYGDPNNNHVSAPGSNCEQFCQCAYDAHLISYYWEVHDCAAGTLFDDTLNVCAHEAAVTCASPTNHPSRSTDTPMSTEFTKGCWALDQCTQTIYEDPNINHVSAPGSNCKQFCQCAYDALLVSYYWSLHNCSDGTLFDDTTNVCDHEEDVTCASQTIYSSPPPHSSDAPTSGPRITMTPDMDGMCSSYGSCDENNEGFWEDMSCRQRCNCTMDYSVSGVPIYQWFIYQCPSDSMFDEWFNNCVHADPTICEATTMPTTTNINIVFK